MSYCGDIRLGKTIDAKFTTRKSDGVPTTLAGSPVISAYPDNSTTQLTAGITLTVDFDGVTGYNNIRVVATGGNGYAAGTNYDLAITTGTVNSVSVVGESVAAFSIENRSALMPATVDRTLVVDAAGLADANTVKLGPSGAGTAQTARDVGASVLVGDKTGFSLSAGGVQAIWDALTAALTTVNSIGKLLVDNINATISSRLATAGYTAPDNASIAGIKVQTDKMTFGPAGYQQVNIKYVNDTQVQGNGSLGNEWRPV